jgi:hypothetical protein
MSKVKQGILGGFSGTIGNVIGGSWKGINYMRIKPVSVANPNTAGQQAQRGAFSAVTDFAKAILNAIIRPLWNPYSSKMSGYNLFTQTNIAAFPSGSFPDPSLLKTTIGTITPTNDCSVAATHANDTVIVGWTDNTGEGQAQSDDVAVVVFQNETSGAIYAEITTTQRNQSPLTIVAPFPMVANDDINVWLSFKDTLGRTGLPKFGSDVAG